ncbi:MAG: N-acetylneuraminate synthase family protein [Candidatus Aminicenantes bacterium]|nr:N-acetylneuraminate synthase family protein [Candidatus Aminicenantes bacterium]
MREDVFDKLFVLDMANNHQGSLEHGLDIVRAVGEKVRAQGVKAALKFQYRDLDTFIHPDFTDSKEYKHIPRFLGTRLRPEDFLELAREVRARGMITMCTPFDEASVDLILEHDLDIIKIASCSSQDWPLLEKIASADKPVICSTGGLVTRELDNLVSFFRHRKVPFALMHCVSVYPTPLKDMSLDRIDFLRSRYPFLKIGFSTHEDPDNLEVVKIAVAKHAAILERHVGLETETVKLNAYSSRPEQLEKWFQAAKEAAVACDFVRDRILPEERTALDSLKRGVYARRPLKKGEPIGREDIFFAMPLQPEQMESGKYKEGLLSYSRTPRHIAFAADRDYAAGEPIRDQEMKDVSAIVFELIHDVKGLLYESRVVIGPEFKVELSHHYGIENIREVGAVIIDVVNREYCKKLIVQVPGQYHPEHYHKKKEETFQVLYGDLIVHYNGEEKILRPGDQILVERGARHDFTTRTGVVVEEISTTHVRNDSYYLDDKVAKDPAARKTKFDLW